ARLAGAQPGQVINLPEGEFRGRVQLPAGVRLKGAGVGKTIIDATGNVNVITVDGGSGATISNLTIRASQFAGVSVSNAKQLTLSKLRVTGGSIGILFG